MRDLRPLRHALKRSAGAQAALERLERHACSREADLLRACIQVHLPQTPD